MGRAGRHLPGSLRRLALAVVLCAAMLGPGPTGDSVHAEAGPCVSRQEPWLAENLADGLGLVLAPHLESVSLRVSAPGRGLECGFGDQETYESASVVKILVLLTTLYRAQEEERELSDREAELLRPMITESDNDATSVLWRSLGRDRLAEMLELAGTEDTHLGPDGSWGLTRISARDLDRLLDLLTGEADVIHDPEPALRLMGEVRADQDWGVSAGAPAGVGVHLKNGWLPRGVRDWRVHSAGIFLGAPHGEYRVTVLTRGSASLLVGVTTIEQLASVVHDHLAGSG